MFFHASCVCCHVFLKYGQNNFSFYQRYGCACFLACRSLLDKTALNFAVSYILGGNLPNPSSFLGLGERFRLLPERKGKNLRAQRFIKTDRLQKRGAFIQLSKIGKKVHSRYFLALFSQNDLARPRMGVTASRKVGNAIKRNRIKRLVREFFRTRGKFFSVGGLDVHIIAKREVVDQPSGLIFSSLQDLFGKLIKKLAD